MLKRVLDVGHKSVVVGLVGLTGFGFFIIGNGLIELRHKRMNPAPAAVKKNEEPVVAAPASK